MRRGSLVALLLLISEIAWSQSKLPVQWEDLTAADFRAGIDRSGGVCMLPFGILEKHGPHLPLGTDLLKVRYASLQAAQREYAIVFPQYYFGQIFEARYEPGTIAYSTHLQLELLQETTDEMARNGCKKILIINGHGGNENLLPFFAQTQLEKEHDYVVYVSPIPDAPPGGPQKKTSLDMHAGEWETSAMLVSNPDLVHMDRAHYESGADLARLNLPKPLYTAIWWYARFPNHYAGDGSAATREYGEFRMKAWEDEIVKSLQAIKADQTSLRLQNEFFQKARNPLQSKP